MSVAIPTAIPVTPFNKILGTCAGKNFGSSSVPSKLGTQSTVPSFNSFSKVCAKGANFDSVYRMAAKDLGSSVEPQLPCPSTKGYR